MATFLHWQTHNQTDGNKQSKTSLSVTQAYRKHVQRTQMFLSLFCHVAQTTHHTTPHITDRLQVTATRVAQQCIDIKYVFSLSYRQPAIHLCSQTAGCCSLSDQLDATTYHSDETILYISTVSTVLGDNHCYIFNFSQPKQYMCILKITVLRHLHYPLNNS